MSLANPRPNLRHHSRMKINVADIADRGPGADFKKTVLAALGDISDEEIQVLGSRILIATYVAPRVTAGGIHLPDASLDEDRWQGKIGLVIKKGATAFKYDGMFKWEDRIPEIGEYVLIDLTSAQTEVGIRGQSCRYLESSAVLSVISDPMLYY